MNAWSVLAGLLVTLGASAGAVLDGGDLVPWSEPASGSTVPTPLGNLTVELPFGGDGNGTEDGNATQPPGNETAPPQEQEEEPAEAGAEAGAAVADCNEVDIYDWSDGLGGGRAEWAFTLRTGNRQLDFELDLGGLFGVALGSTAYAELVDPSGHVVASVEHGVDGLLGPSAYMTGTVDAPLPGLWRLSVEAEGFGGSYYVSAASGCGAEAQERDAEGEEAQDEGEDE